MQRIVLFLCVAATLFSLCGCEKNYTHGVYEVAITATENYNDSVGDDWKIVYSCDGRIITSGESWTVPLTATKTVKIDATITERENYPDVAYGSLSVTLKDGFETSTNITITEDRGKYAGNTAQWKVTCKVNLKKKMEM